MTSSVHGTHMHAQEIKNNIALVRFATADIERDDYNEQLKLSIKEWIHSRNKSIL
jgi:hypothetical protein